MIARSSHSSPRNRLKLTMEGLRYFNVPKEQVSALQKYMKNVLGEMETAENTVDHDVPRASAQTAAKIHSHCSVDDEFLMFQFEFRLILCTLFLDSKQSS